MTEHYSKNITPDSLTGMLFAMEGMKNSVVLLNGPMGCKFYHSTTSQHLALRPPLYLPVREGGEKAPVSYHFLNDFFFRQPRIPCTYLDGYDYVYGTGEKVAQGLRYIRDNVDFDVIALVNSPGASLIGDHLEDLIHEILPGRNCVVLESPGFSDDFGVGYEEAVLQLLRQVGVPLWTRRSAKHAEEGHKGGVKTVNILGLSIWQRYWEGDLEEIRRLLGLCNIRVNCSLCAGSFMEDVAHLPDADLNVVINREMGSRTAAFLQEQCGIPFYICPSLPIGFAATQEMVAGICSMLQADDSAFTEECEKARALSWFKINGIHEMCGLPQGAAFAVEGTSLVVYSFSRFFIEYLGMSPDCLAITGGDSDMKEKLQELLEDHQLGHPERKDLLDTKAELVFADANTIAALSLNNKVFCGIEISLPGMGYVDVLPKTQYGIKGSLFLVEQVLNGLMSKI